MDRSFDTGMTGSLYKSAEYLTKERNDAQADKEREVYSPENPHPISKSDFEPIEDNSYLLLGTGDVDEDGVDLGVKQFVAGWLHGEKGYDFPKSYGKQVAMASACAKIFRPGEIEAANDFSWHFKLMRTVDDTGENFTPRTIEEQAEQFREYILANERVVETAKKYDINGFDAIAETAQKEKFEKLGVRPDEWEGMTQSERYQRLVEKGYATDALGFEPEKWKEWASHYAKRGVANVAAGQAVDEFSGVNMRSHIPTNDEMRIASHEWKKPDVDNYVNAEQIVSALKDFEQGDIALDGTVDRLAKHIYENGKDNGTGYVVYESSAGDMFRVAKVPGKNGDRFIIDVANDGWTERLAKLNDIAWNRVLGHKQYVYDAMYTNALIDSDPELKKLYMGWVEYQDKTALAEELQRRMSQHFTGGAKTPEQEQAAIDEFNRQQNLLHLISLRNNSWGLTHRNMITGLLCNSVNSVTSIAKGLTYDFVTGAGRGYRGVYEMMSDGDEAEQYRRFMRDQLNAITEGGTYSYGTLVGGVTEEAVSLFGFGVAAKFMRVSNLVKMEAAASSRVGLATMKLGKATGTKSLTSAGKAMVRHGANTRHWIVEKVGGVDGHYSNKIQLSSAGMKEKDFAKDVSKHKKMLKDNGWSVKATESAGAAEGEKIVTLEAKRPKFKPPKNQIEYQTKAEKLFKEMDEELSGKSLAQSKKIIEEYALKDKQLRAEHGLKMDELESAITTIVDELPFALSFAMENYDKKRMETAYTLGQEMESGFDVEAWKATQGWDLAGGLGQGAIIIGITRPITALLEGGEAPALSNSLRKALRAFDSNVERIALENPKMLPLVERWLQNEIRIAAIKEATETTAHQFFMGAGMAEVDALAEKNKQIAIAKTRDPNYNPTLGDRIDIGEQGAIDALASGAKFAVAGSFLPAGAKMVAAHKKNKEVRHQITAAEAISSVRRIPRLAEQIRKTGRFAEIQNNTVAVEEAKRTLYSSLARLGEALKLGEGRRFDTQKATEEYLKIRREVEKEIGKRNTDQLEEMVRDLRFDSHKVWGQFPYKIPGKDATKEEIAAYEKGLQDFVFAHEVREYRRQIFSRENVREQIGLPEDWKTAKDVMGAVEKILGLKVKEGKDGAVEVSYSPWVPKETAATKTTEGATQTKPVEQTKPEQTANINYETRVISPELKTTTANGEKMFDVSWAKELVSEVVHGEHFKDELWDDIRTRIKNLDESDLARLNKGEDVAQILSHAAERMAKSGGNAGMYDVAGKKVVLDTAQLAKRPDVATQWRTVGHEFSHAILDAMRQNGALSTEAYNKLISAYATGEEGLVSAIAEEGVNRMLGKALKDVMRSFEEEPSKLQKFKDFIAKAIEAIVGKDEGEAEEPEKTILDRVSEIEEQKAQKVAKQEVHDAKVDELRNEMEKEQGKFVPREDAEDVVTMREIAEEVPNSKPLESKCKFEFFDDDLPPGDYDPNRPTFCVCSFTVGPQKMDYIGRRGDVYGQSMHAHAGEGHTYSGITGLSSEYNDQYSAFTLIAKRDIVDPAKNSRILIGASEDTWSGTPNTGYKYAKDNGLISKEMEFDEFIKFPSERIADIILESDKKRPPRKIHDGHGIHIEMEESWGERRDVGNHFPYDTLVTTVKLPSGMEHLEFTVPVSPEDNQAARNAALEYANALTLRTLDEVKEYVFADNRFSNAAEAKLYSVAKVDNFTLFSPIDSRVYRPEMSLSEYVDATENAFGAILGWSKDKSGDDIVRSGIGVIKSVFGNDKTTKLSNLVESDMLDRDGFESKVYKASPVYGGFRLMPKKQAIDSAYIIYKGIVNGARFITGAKGFAEKGGHIEEFIDVDTLGNPTVMDICRGMAITNRDYLWPELRHSAPELLKTLENAWYSHRITKTEAIREFMKSDDGADYRWEMVLDSGMDRLNGMSLLRDTINNTMRQVVDGVNFVSVKDATGWGGVHFYDSQTKIKVPKGFLKRAAKEKFTVGSLFGNFKEGDEILKKAYPSVYDGEVYVTGTARYKKAIADGVITEPRFETENGKSKHVALCSKEGNIIIDRDAAVKAQDSANGKLNKDFARAVADSIRIAEKKAGKQGEEILTADKEAAIEAIFPSRAKKADSGLTYWLADERLLNPKAESNIIRSALDKYLEANGVKEAIKNDDQFNAFRNQMLNDATQAIRTALTDAIENNFSTTLNSDVMGEGFGLSAEEAAKAYEDSRSIISGGLVAKSNARNSTSQVSKKVRKFYEDVVVKEIDKALFGPKKGGDTGKNSLKKYFNEAMFEDTFWNIVKNINRGSRAARTIAEERASDGRKRGEAAKPGDKGIKVGVSAKGEAVEHASASIWSGGSSGDLQTGKEKRALVDSTMAVAKLDDGWTTNHDRIIAECAADAKLAMMKVLKDAGGDVKKALEKVSSPDFAKSLDFVGDKLSKYTGITDEMVLDGLREYVTDQAISQITGKTPTYETKRYVSREDGGSKYEFIGELGVNTAYDTAKQYIDGDRADEFVREYGISPYTVIDMHNKLLDAKAAYKQAGFTGITYSLRKDVFEKTRWFTDKGNVTDFKIEVIFKSALSPEEFVKKVNDAGFYGIKVGDVFPGTKLFYAGLSDVPIKRLLTRDEQLFGETNSIKNYKRKGTSKFARRYIKLKTNSTREVSDIIKTLHHELQHVIQSYEAWKNYGEPASSRVGNESSTEKIKNVGELAKRVLEFVADLGTWSNGEDAGERLASDIETYSHSEWSSSKLYRQYKNWNGDKNTAIGDIEHIIDCVSNTGVLDKRAIDTILTTPFFLFYNGNWTVGHERIRGMGVKEYAFAIDLLRKVLKKAKGNVKNANSILFSKVLGRYITDSDYYRYRNASHEVEARNSALRAVSDKVRDAFPFPPSTEDGLEQYKRMPILKYSAVDKDSYYTYDYELYGGDRESVLDHIAEAAGAQFVKEVVAGGRRAGKGKSVERYISKQLRLCGMQDDKETVKKVMNDAVEIATGTLGEFSGKAIDVAQASMVLKGKARERRIINGLYKSMSSGISAAEAGTASERKAKAIADRAIKRQLEEATGLTINQINLNLGFNAIGDLDKISDINGIETPEAFAARFISGFCATAFGKEGLVMLQRDKALAANTTQDPITRQELALTLSSWLKYVGKTMLYGRERESAMRNAEMVLATKPTFAEAQDLIARFARMAGEYQRRQKVQSLINGWKEKEIWTDDNGVKHERTINHKGIVDMIDEVAMGGKDMNQSLSATKRTASPLEQQYWKLVKDSMQMTTAAKMKRIAELQRRLEATDSEYLALTETELARLKGEYTKEQAAEESVRNRHNDMLELSALLKYGAMRDMKYGVARDLFDNEMAPEIAGGAAKWAAQIEARRAEIAADKSSLLNGLSKQIAKDIKKGRDYTAKNPLLRGFLVTNVPDLFKRLSFYLPEGSQSKAVTDKLRQQFSLAHINQAMMMAKFEGDFRATFKKIYGKSIEQMMPELMMKRDEYSKFSRANWNIDSSAEPVEVETFSGKKKLKRAKVDSELEVERLSKANLMYIYMSMVQKDMAVNNFIYGRDEAYMRELKSVLTPQDMAFIAYLHEAYNRIRETISPVSERVTGCKVLAPDELYSPLMFMQDDISMDGNRYSTSIFPGFLTNRINHDAAKLNEQTDVFRLFLNHSTDAAHYGAFAELIDYSNQVFKDAKVQNAYFKIFGKKAKDEIFLQLSDALNGGRRATGLFSNIRNFVTSSSLFYNISSAIKQMEGIGAWALKMGPLGLARALVRRSMYVLDDKTRQGTRELMEAGLFSTRSTEGFSESMIAVMDSMADIEGKVPGRGKRLYNLYKKHGMVLTQFVDHLATRSFAGNYYMGRKEWYMDHGRTEEDAKRLALADTDYAVQISQQSGRQEFMRGMQRGDVPGRLLAQFAGPTFLRFGEEVAALHRAFVVDKDMRAFKKLFSKMLALHVICPAILSSCNAASSYVFTDKDDDEIKEEFFKNWAISSVIGPMSGWFIWGQVMSGIAHRTVAPKVKTTGGNALNLPAYGKLAQFVKSTSNIANEVFDAAGGAYVDVDEVQEETMKLIGVLIPGVGNAIKAYNNIKNR